MERIESSLRRCPRVIFLGYGFDTAHGGGGEHAMTEFATRLADLGYPTQVIIVSAGERVRRESFSNLSVEVLSAPFLSFLRRKPFPTRMSKLAMQILTAWNPVTTWRLKRVLQRSAADVLVTNSVRYMSPAVWGVAKASGMRVVHLMHSYALLCRLNTMRREDMNCTDLCWSCRQMMRVKQRNAPQVDRALGVSYHVTTAHTEHGFFDESQSATISNIVKKSYCRLPGSFQSPLTFGFLGHIGPTKGLHILLEAYSRLSHPGVGPLLVAGSANPQYKAALQERHRDPRIEWRGYVDPAAFLLEIDILVVPSVWQEPQGRVALEALRHGVPVIASAVGGLRDMAAYTEGVRLIPSGDAVALYQTMAELIARPFRVREMSRAAPDIDALCSPQAVMDGLADAVDGPAQADAARTAPSASAAWAAASRSKHGGTSP